MISLFHWNNIAVLTLTSANNWWWDKCLVDDLKEETSAKLRSVISWYYKLFEGETTNNKSDDDFLHCNLKTACQHQLIFMAQALIKSSTVAPMPLNTLQRSSADSLRVNLPKIRLCNAASSTEQNWERLTIGRQKRLSAANLRICLFHFSPLWLLSNKSSWKILSNGEDEKLVTQLCPLVQN